MKVVDENRAIWVELTTIYRSLNVAKTVTCGHLTWFETFRTKIKVLNSFEVLLEHSRTSVQDKR